LEVLFKKKMFSNLSKYKLLSHHITQKSYEFGSSITGNQASPDSPVCTSIFYATTADGLVRRDLDGTVTVLFPATLSPGHNAFTGIAHDGITLVFTYNNGTSFHIYTIPLVVAMSATGSILGLVKNVAQITEGNRVGISTNGSIWYFWGYDLKIGTDSVTSPIWSSNDLVKFTPVKVNSLPINTSISSMAYKYPLWVAVGYDTDYEVRSWTFNECTMTWTVSNTFPPSFWGPGVPNTYVNFSTVRSTSFNGINFVAIAYHFFSSRAFTPLISRDGLSWSFSSTPVLTGEIAFDDVSNIASKNVTLAAGSNGNMVFVTCQNNIGYPHFFYTCDNGATWTQSRLSATYDSNINVKRTAVVYMGAKMFVVVLGNSTVHYLLMSQDGGVNFTMVSLLPEPGGGLEYPSCVASCVSIHQNLCKVLTN
jgi:hypothetical protein